MDPLAPLIETLHAGHRPRVWSLIVTVFGDAVLPRGGEMPLSRLQVLLGRVGVEAGTIRTALSRLSQDGWVARRREGRLSFYHLSDPAAAETRAAMRQIYAPPITADRWALHLGQAPPRDALKIGTAAWLAPHDPNERAFLVASPQTRLPKEVLAQDHRAALELLEQDLSALPPEKQGELSPLDAAAARILLIHRWRRFALRYPHPLPAPDPRSRVAAAYGALFAASEAWLDSDIDGIAPMPAPEPEGALQTRFQNC